MHRNLYISNFEVTEMMWKEIGSIVKKLILLLFPFFLLLPLYCMLFPENYLDGEYAMYRQQQDYVQGKTGTAARVLIVGDSRTKAGMDPALLWEGSYNIALGGTTPIEGYYALKEYIETHADDLPQTVVIAYAPMHYMDVDTLWTRCIYFHTLRSADFSDLVSRAKSFQDTEHILIDHCRLEYLQYKFYMPNKYATALKKAVFCGRRQENLQKYAQVEADSGHTYYGTADHSDDVDGEAKVSDFSASDIITSYLTQMFLLCRENNIQVILEQTPVNETSYKIFTRELKDHYRGYMANLVQEFPDVLFYPDFYCYPNDCFGDADHLNKKGVEAFCGYLKEKYPQL